MYMGHNCKNIILLKFYVFIWNVTGALLFLFAKSGSYDWGVLKGQGLGFDFLFSENQAQIMSLCLSNHSVH